jgi:hypothetical protein
MVLKRPVNWNGNTVTIENVVRTGVSVDPVFKTPVNKKLRTTVHTYNAQINLGTKEQDRKMRTLSGDRPNTTGHIVLRTCDLAPHTALPRPEKGWKITALYAGTPLEETVDWLIEEVRLESPLRGQPLLVYCEFEHNRDRSRS